MLATIVNSSTSTAQIFLLIAVIVFVIYEIAQLTLRAFYSSLLGAGLALVALGLLFSV